MKTLPSGFPTTLSNPRISEAECDALQHDLYGRQAGLGLRKANPQQKYGIGGLCNAEPGEKYAFEGLRKVKPGEKYASEGLRKVETGEKYAFEGLRKVKPGEKYVFEAEFYSEHIIFYERIKII